VLQSSIQKIDQWRYKLISHYCIGKTLDVACGLKGLSEFITPNQYMGCDLRGGDIQCTAYQLPFGNQSFDTIVLGEALEHLGMPLVALKEAGRVARTRIVVTVPNNYSLVKLSRLLLHREVEIETKHILSYNSWNLKMLLKEIGFKTIETFSYPLRLQFVPEIPVKSQFGYWLFAIADRWPKNSAHQKKTGL
jgi:ubiquinone/menaquinone biosynthesis C-methylase UbiE